MENQNSISQISKKNPKPILVLFGVLIIVIVGVIGLFIFNKNITTETPTPQINNSVQNSTDQESIPTYTELENEDVTFKYPSGYEFEEEKDRYIIYKPRKSSELEKGIFEAVIIIYKPGQNPNYQTAVNEARNNLTDAVEKEIPNGIKMYGKIKEGPGIGTPTLYVFIKSGNGAIVIESSGKIINEGVFDQVADSVKTN